MVNILDFRLKADLALCVRAFGTPEVARDSDLEVLRRLYIWMYVCLFGRPDGRLAR
jgi:hypothetical protein